MPEEHSGQHTDAAGIDAAIAQVLQAEREAREEVRRCAAEAEAIVDRAHERARQISRRAAHRSVRVQRWLASQLQYELGRLAEQQTRTERVVAPTDAPHQLSRAVESLAAQLTGAAP